MPAPSIVFNSSTGSDTAASGAGPSTALSGTAASLNASTTVTLSVDSPNLSGVAVDGTACLWVDTTTGRQFSAITAIDNTAKTVTVANAYTVTESGRNWGIGGKRKDFNNTNSRKLFSADMGSGWEVVTETDQDVSSTAITVSAGLNTVIRGDSEVIRRVITQSSNTAIFTVTATPAQFRNLDFRNSSVSKTSSSGIQCSASGGPQISAINCTFGGSSNTLRYGFLRSNGTPLFTAISCDFHNCEQSISMLGSTCTAINCRFKDNSVNAILFSGGSNCICTILGCLFVGNIGTISHGSSTSTFTLQIANCTFDSNIGNVIAATSTSSGPGQGGYIVNSVFSNNTGWALDLRAEAFKLCMFEKFNNFFNNTSGNWNGFSIDATDLTLDPQYTNPAGGDYSIGNNLKSVGFPKSDTPIGINSATYSFVDIGAAQSQSGGGSRPRNPFTQGVIG